mgnify:CR=1 FL=1
MQIEKQPGTLPHFNNAQVLVVGDVMLDRYWFGDVSRISPEAPVPVVRIVANVTNEALNYFPPVGLARVALAKWAGSWLCSQSRKRALTPSASAKSCVHCIKLRPDFWALVASCVGC